MSGDNDLVSRAIDKVDKTIDKVDDKLMRLIPEPILNGLTALLLVAALTNLGVAAHTRYKQTTGKTPSQVEESWRTVNPILRYGTSPGRYFEHAMYELDRKIDELTRKF